jgi:hydroxypyruvate isomerase
MVRYAANLTMLFNEVPFAERFELAATAGFRAVEFLFAHNVDQDAVERELARNGLELVLFDPEGGDFPAGDRGYLCDPARRDHLLKTIEDAIVTAGRFGCRRLNVLAGNRVEGASDAEMRRTVVENLRRAAPRARAAGIMLLVEALNTWESPRYFLDRSRLGLDIVREVGEPNVRFQYDCYHMQRMEGQLIETLTKNLEWIGHVQIADVPGRHEPGTGEVNYPNVLRALDAAGYEGYVGLEYRPSGKTEDSLAWLPREERGRH